MRAGEAACARGVVQRSQQGDGAGDLGIGPALEAGRDPTGEVAEGVPSGRAEAEVARGAGETLLMEVTEQFGDEGGRHAHRPPYRVSDPDHTTPPCSLPP